MKLIIPDNNIPERSYIIDIILNEFLGIEYSLEEKDKDFYEIIIDDNKSIHFKDSFFNLFHEPLSYLKREHIPTQVLFSENQFTFENNIPIIYGTPDIQIEENKIICGIDIFASAFFMLTRWEEHVIEEKDKHGRVPDNMQFSVKHKIHERPVVNEYAEMLRNMLLFMGCQSHNKHTYNAVITHDIDFFLRYDKISKMIKAVVGDILKRNSMKEAIRSFRTFFKVKNGTLKDPYETFDYLMQQSESIGLKSRFYFIPSMIGEPDAHYNINNNKVIQSINEITDRGHIIGVHGAYRSYKDLMLFTEELKRFPTVTSIEESRQHFLRFENPETWQMLQDAGIKTDSTMAFTNHVGFRSGTCYEYSLFNILSREKLSLVERPLIVMEQALKKELPNQEAFFSKIIEMKEKVEEYSGTFVLLWHNNNFNTLEWNGYSELYERLIKNL